MSVIKEFKAFAMRGNVVDLAVGLIIGAAFGKIVTSFVGDVLMPPVGIRLGVIDFSSFSITLKAASGGTPAVTLGYGKFLNTVIDFVIVAFCVFLLVKTMNTLKRTDVPAPTTQPCPQCKMEIPIGALKCGHCGSQL